MKSSLGALAALLFAAALTLARAEDIKTVTGKEYKNVKISRAEPDGLVIIVSYGIIKIPFEELPPNLREKYHYDAQTASNFRKQLQAAKTLANQETESALKKRAAELEAANKRAAELQSADKRAAELESENNHATQPAVPTSSPSAPSSAPHSLPAVYGEPWAIKGKVLSSTDDGVIVYCINDQSFGRSKPDDRSVVFVRGLNLMDGDAVNVEAIPYGTYKYTAVSGAAKTVRAFQLH